MIKGDTGPDCQQTAIMRKRITFLGKCCNRANWNAAAKIWYKKYFHFDFFHFWISIDWPFPVIGLPVSRFYASLTEKKKICRYLLQIMRWGNRSTRKKLFFIYGWHLLIYCCGSLAIHISIQVIFFRYYGIISGVSPI